MYYYILKADPKTDLFTMTRADMPRFKIVSKSLTGVVKLDKEDVTKQLFLYYGPLGASRLAAIRNAAYIFLTHSDAANRMTRHNKRILEIN